MYPVLQLADIFVTVGLLLWPLHGSTAAEVLHGCNQGLRHVDVRILPVQLCTGAEVSGREKAGKTLAPMRPRKEAFRRRCHPATFVQYASSANGASGQLCRERRGRPDRFLRRRRRTALHLPDLVGSGPHVAGLLASSRGQVLRRRRHRASRLGVRVRSVPETPPPLQVRHGGLTHTPFYAGAQNKNEPRGFNATKGNYTDARSLPKPVSP
uniref:Putative secreted protein n=1 Tax=Ixodes ricinus TaxID=34613 RepID=A0A6B0V1X4_IXORI